MQTDKVEILLSIIEQNNKTIEELQSENVALSNILVRIGHSFKSDSHNTQPQLFNSKTNGGVLKTAQAIKQEFLNNPTKQFSPAELRDTLLLYIKNGKVSTSAKNVLYAVHTALRALKDRGTIEKIQLAERESVYKLVQ